MRCVLQGCAICCRVVPCVAAERGRDHHHDDLTLRQRAVVRCSVVPRAAACCRQPLHHVPCAVAADTCPPASRCQHSPAPTLATAACPFWAAMKRQLQPFFSTHMISGMPPSLHSTCTHAAPRVSCACVWVGVCVCVRQWMRGREKARARGGGREKEMKRDSVCVLQRVALRSHAARGVWVSCAIYRGFLAPLIVCTRRM